jgi:methylated-DNA-[protein]-cysteine S-methyltransferase
MMNFALFETALGCCGIVWSERGIVGVQLPERSEAATLKRLLRRFPAAHEGEPPAEVRRAIDDIVALLGGERRDLNQVRIDLDAVSEFHRRVYEAARRIPAGARFPTAKSPSLSATAIWPATSRRPCRKIPARSSCPVIGFWRLTASRGAFPPREGWRQSFGFSRSKAHNPKVVWKPPSYSTDCH